MSHRFRDGRPLAGVRQLPEQLWRELRLGTRRLAAAPLFAVFAVLTLAVAIGVTTAVYSGIYTAFRTTRTTHVEGDEDLLRLYGSPISWRDYQELSAQQTSLKSLAAWTQLWTALVVAGTPDLVLAEGIHGEYFGTLGVHARLGRTLNAGDDRVDAPPAAMVSERTWRERFDSSPNVLGSAVKIVNRPFTIVGVVPESFRGMSARPVAVWVPASHVPAADDGVGPFVLMSRESARVSVIGRLKPATSLEQAHADVALISNRLDATSPLPQGTSVVGAGPAARSWSWRSGFHTDRPPATQDSARIVLGLPMLVFLVACTNLANLMLSRGIARRHALAVRRALGASRARLVREEMAETVIVAGLGGLSGLLLSQALVGGALAFLNDTLTALAPGAIPAIRLEPMVIAFAVGGAFLTMAVAGFVPAWQVTRLGTRHVLVADADTSSPRWRGRSNLIALQVTASAGLFLVAVVCVRELSDGQLRVVGPAPNGLAVAAVPFGAQQHSESRVRETVNHVLREMRTAQGVDAVAAAAGLSLTQGTLPTYRHAWVASPDKPLSGDDTKDLSTSFAMATPGIFRVLGTPLLSGRGFEDRDAAGAERVAVVSEALASALFGISNVVGRHVQLAVSPPGRSSRSETREIRIIGVVPEIDSRGRPSKQVYLPLAQEYDANLAFLVRPVRLADGPPVAALRRALRDADPDVAIPFAGPSDVLTAGRLVLFRFVVFVTAGLAALALLLAMTGLYGVLSHVVARRTRELGLRMALGADSGRVVRMVLREGLRPVVEGLAIGLCVAMMLRMLLQATMEGQLAPIDPAACLLAIVLLLAAALAACYVPARRASRVDPNVALKDL